MIFSQAMVDKAGCKVIWVRKNGKRTPTFWAYCTTGMRKITYGEVLEYANHKNYDNMKKVYRKVDAKGHGKVIGQAAEMSVTRRVDQTKASYGKARFPTHPTSCKCSGCTAR